MVFKTMITYIAEQSLQIGDFNHAVTAKSLEWIIREFSFSNIAEAQTLEAFEAIDMETSVYESLPFHFKLKVNFQQGREHSNNSLQLADAFRLLEMKKEEIGIHVLLCFSDEPGTDLRRLIPKAV